MKEMTPYDSKQPQVSLLQASQNANQLLKLVLQDQSSISQALKMTHENDSSSLRWYVYPKEVANYIKKGLDEVPGTNDRHNLIGALRPLAWYPNENAVKPALGNSTTVESFQFRDNEHSGAAPLDEIQQGYEDGELSDACQIYNPRKYTWGGDRRLFKVTAVDIHEDENAHQSYRRQNGNQEGPICGK
jgi:hypothetical protein